MINNGFVNKEAITFKITKLEEAEIKKSGTFMLFQYNPDSSNSKILWMNGDIKLPATALESATFMERQVENIAIIGKEVSTTIIPANYKIAGYFTAKNSYLLNSEAWLLPRSRHIDLNKGNYFVFNTTARDKVKLLNEIIHPNKIEIIDEEKYGTYSLYSNRSLLLGLQLFFILIIVIYFLINNISLNKEKYLISIMHTTGYTLSYIYIAIFKYRVIPCIVCSTIMILISIVVKNYLYPTWGEDWISYSIITIMGSLLLMMVQSLFVVFIHSIKKGGKKY
ncbi:hypothetical protein [Paenibacillus arenosi]|uniref:Uncharacterized protein n=1 Tax=Paenibacillus arenosi TaxID=2774142 RepID=A0ABR9AWF2_9BACL|nr:hypothetical protein [Paenibacillus arenosi]MBD8498466.1 hypothetical protein [Paenibacillus arenosi]